MLKDAANGQKIDSVEKKSPSKLVDYIVEKHHLFTRQEIGRLTTLMEKVCHKHGEKHSRLLELRKVFRILFDDLTVHMRKEELVLFPYIKNLEVSQKSHSFVPYPHFGTVQNPVRIMMTEHDAAGDFLKEIRQITNDYTAPENACPSFKTLYFGLAELEKDLHQHIYLKNNILFLLASLLEQRVFFGR